MTRETTAPGPARTRGVAYRAVAGQRSQAGAAGPLFPGEDR